LILILLGLQGFSQETKSAVLQRIDKNVYENITHQMRGDSLNAVLKAMVNSLASYTVSSSSGSITPTSVTTQTIIINNSGIATYTIAPRDSTTVIPNTKWCEQNFVKSVGEIAGNGIGITGVSPIVGYGTYTVTNTAPDKTVILTGGTGMRVTSAYPSFTVTNTSPNINTTIVAGTGITVTGTTPSYTVTNSSPSSGGTVTSVTVTTNAGVSGTVANPTTTPAISLTLGSITPTNVTTNAITANTGTFTTVTTSSLTVTTPITGSVTGNAATVTTNANLT